LWGAGSVSTPLDQFYLRRCVVQGNLNLPWINYLTKLQSPVVETQQATALLDKLRDLIISYAGLTLQEPEMFPQPIEYVLPITCHLIDASLTPSLSILTH
jgi:hypothetical protein